MSTLKSSAEDLTLNADGSGNDVIIQSNGSTKAIVTAEGNVGIGTPSPTTQLTLAKTSDLIFTQNDYGIGWGTVNNPSPKIFGTTGSHLKFKAGGGSVAMTIDSSGNVTADIGNLVIGTAGKGIDFSATSDGTTMSSELLDDYEEGTWTPVISGSTSTSGQTYDAQTGSYTKIGNKVFCSFNMDLSAKGTIVGFLKITGFPFTMSPAHQNACTFGNTRQWYLTADHHLQGTVYGTNIVYLYECSQQADVPSQLDTNALVDSTIVLGSFFFTTTD